MALPHDDEQPRLSERVIHRIKRNGRRLAYALRHGGPGRLTGAVVAVEADNNEMVVTGWAANPAVDITAVLVTVDPHPVVVATIGLPTPLGRTGSPVTDRSPIAGWEARLERRHLPGGPVTVGALAVRGDQLVDDLVPLTVTIPDRVLGSLDQPPPDEVVHGPHLLVRGWSVDQRLDHIDVRVGDGPSRRARVWSEPRSDVAAVFDTAVAPMAGWFVMLDVDRPAEEQKETLYVDVVTSTGSHRLAERDIVLASEPARSSSSGAIERLMSASAGTASSHRPSRDRLSLLVGTHQLSLGGGQLYLQELLRHLLAADDIECTVLATVDGPLRDELELWGADVRLVDPVPMNGATYEAQMLEAIELAAATGANVVLANTIGSFWAVDLAARLGLPSVWAIHESFDLDRFAVEGLGAIDGHVRGRLDEALASAAALVFEADATATLVAGPERADRSIRIDYGIDIDRIDAFRSSHDRAGLRRAHRYADDDVVLLCMGTFEPRKAQASLCAAFDRVAKKYPRARLALVGDTGSPFSEGIRELVGRLDAGSRIELVPVTSDIDSWYHLADGFVLASDVESLPRSMLEVMAFEVPVIGSSVFGIPELITDGVDGMLFEPYSLDSLTAALDRFLALDREARRELGRCGRERVVPARDSRNYAATYRRLFDGLRRDPAALPSSLV
jgi:glycosyltransferase involved in cell wall biosynthesis